VGQRLYFAYGSNLSWRRISAPDRAPSATLVGRAELGCHVLRLHKRGRDGSAKCDAFATGNEEDRVLGVVYRINAADEAALDRVEGLGVGYDKVSVTVKTETAASAVSSMQAMTYVARPSHIDPTLMPFDWYMKLVLEGAREHGLDEEYVELLDRIPTGAQISPMG